MQAAILVFLLASSMLLAGVAAAYAGSFKDADASMSVMCDFSE